MYRVKYNPKSHRPGLKARVFNMAIFEDCRRGIVSAGIERYVCVQKQAAKEAARNA